MCIQWLANYYSRYMKSPLSRPLRVVKILPPTVGCLRISRSGILFDTMAKTRIILETKLRLVSIKE